jgi:selenocysteine lyase/cysteine desulfurase
MSKQLPDLSVNPKHRKGIPVTLELFEKKLSGPEVIGALQRGIIGDNIEIVTPHGKMPLVYADYTASGRALAQVEEFVAEHVLPYYANSHTESSFCGAYTTKLREEARRVIARETNAGDDFTVIFSGSGATAGVNRLVSLCNVADQKQKPTVFIGPFEHHSNILPWRESGVEVIEIDEDVETGIDLKMLERELSSRNDGRMLIGSFSAASNVTGILTDVDVVTALLKKYNALSFWDYAGGAPYLTIDMAPAAGLEKDAVFLSPHKFPGGPGASGLLIIKNSIVKNGRPTWPGGGSVAYVSPWDHDYLDSISEREEAGTPNIIGDIRAALVFLVKAAVGQEFITRRNNDLVKKALDTWNENPMLNILAGDRYNRIPIFSFIVNDEHGKHYHHQLVTQLLSDATGIQARGGCACAGPYGHRLLGVEKEQSEHIRHEISQGKEIEKPGWVRLNLSYLFTDRKVDYILEKVGSFPKEISELSKDYDSEAATAKFVYHIDKAG